MATTRSASSPARRAAARLFACTAAILLLAGCNTMEGLGRDAQAAGKALEDAARDVAD